MEADRTAVLTLRAHLCGAIDFSQARILDVTWWRRSAAILRALETENENKSLEAVYAYHRALLSNGQLTKESFEAAQKQSRILCNDVLNTLRPWAKQTLEGAATNERQSAAEQYRTKIGNLQDPDFQKKVMQEVEILKARGAEAAKHNAELMKKVDSKKRQRKRRTARRSKNA